MGNKIIFHIHLLSFNIYLCIHWHVQTSTVNPQSACGAIRMSDLYISLMYLLVYHCNIGL